jgi:hypothetical protein
MRKEASGACHRVVLPLPWNVLGGCWPLCCNACQLPNDGGGLDGAPPSSLLLAPPGRGLAFAALAGEASHSGMFGRA